MSPSLGFRISDRSVKHLAGHQFVIGRVVTGMYCLPVEESTSSKHR